MTISLLAQYLTTEGDTLTHWLPSTAFNALTPDSSTDYCEFVIDNTNPVSSQGPGGYSIHLLSNEDGFSYQDDSNIPVAGSEGGDIACVEVVDSSNNVYFKIRGNFADPLLSDFWNTYLSSGAKAALDQLVGSGLTMCGSDQNDYAETYGTGGHYDLGDGNDTLYISYSDTTAIGGTGNDTFVITKGGLFGLDLNGGSPIADGAPETNTVDFTGNGTLTFDTLVGVTNFVFGPSNGGQYIYLRTDQLPGGGKPVFHVTGSSTANPNEIVIEHASTGALNLNMAGVVASNFTKYNQAFIFDFSGDTARDVVTGVKNTHNVFELGSANDVAFGQNLSDFFTGGHGNDHFNGGGGVDTAFFDGPRGAFTVVHSTTNPHMVTIHDTRVNSPDGTDTLVNVEWATFSNGHLFIG